MADQRIDLAEKAFDPDEYLDTKLQHAPPAPPSAIAARVLTGDVDRVFLECCIAFAQTVPDYNEVVGKAQIPIPQHVVDYIKTSPNGAALGYHLAKNLETCRRVAWMPRARAIEVLKKIERTLQVSRLSLVH